MPLPLHTHLKKQEYRSIQSNNTLNNKRYAIIDIESTGGKATTDRITEVGIVLIENGITIDEFTSLVNPERSIPPFITKITGITNQMVQDAPKFYEVAKRIIEITEDAVFVAHNSSFDYSFIKEEFRQLGFDFKRKTLCTVKLTRKAFPGLASYSLGKLINHFGITVTDRHRAMEDAQATTIIFKKIIDKKDNHEYLDHFLNHGVVASRLNYGITMELLNNLPESIGIYYFYNVHGDIIYIGKSINIQHRVMQHFAGNTKKNDKIIFATASISYELTGSELVALIEESIEIKKHQPEINKALKSTAKYFIYQQIDELGYITFKVSKNSAVTRHNKHILHFTRSKKLAYQYLQNLREEFQLCDVLCDIDTEKIPCFRHNIKLCNGACFQLESADDYNIRANQAIDNIRDKFGRDFLIIDEGQSTEDFSVIYVKDGLFHGYKYIDTESLNTNEPKEIAALIPSIGEQFQCNRIIKTYIEKTKVHSIIQLDASI